MAKTGQKHGIDMAKTGQKHGIDMAKTGQKHGIDNIVKNFFVDIGILLFYSP